VSYALVQKILFVVFPLGLVFGAVSDFLTFTIPNRLVIGLLAAFVVMAPIVGMDVKTIALHAAAGALILSCTFAFFAFGWIGGGDAKFAAIIALWLGWSHTLEFVLTAAILGGVLTLIVLIFRRSMLPGFALRQPWIFRLHSADAGVPYGIALAAAGLIVYPQTIWIRMAAG
jgi:prepilin peptidase CpaA